MKSTVAPIVLFIATILSTCLMYAPDLTQGVIYSVTVMSILLAHELGHYLTCRHYLVSSSLPYFIPMPFPPFGTMGAIIKMDTRIPNRRVLFDIAAAGPLAGIIIAVPAIVFGLDGSVVRKVPPDALTFGDSLLLKFLVFLQFGELTPGTDVFLHPVAYGGWVGLFVTALNLLPIGQLDGGHIVFSLIPRQAEKFYIGGITVLLLFCFFVNPGYLLFAGLLFLMKLRHPPTLDQSIELTTERRIMAIFILVFFLISFTPDPINSGDSPAKMLFEILENYLDSRRLLLASVTQ